MKTLSPVRSRCVSALRSLRLAHRLEAAYGDKRGDVQLQPEEKAKKDLKRLPDVRQDLVDRIKKQIAEGTYMTPEKVRKAISELLKELPDS